VGAVVVYLPGPTPSGELEARPAGDPTRRFHTGVHPRDVGGATTQVAVYPEIVEGTYEILDEHLAPVARVDVRGGEVTELHLH
jgi:hypothetical protein